jgi:hypothetical protein
MKRGPIPNRDLRARHKAGPCFPRALRCKVTPYPLHKTSDHSERSCARLRGVRPKNLSRKNRARKRQALRPGPASTAVPGAARLLPHRPDEAPSRQKRAARFDLKAALSREERPQPKWLRILFATLWYAIGFALLLMTIGYCAIHLTVGLEAFSVISIFVFFFMIAVLFLGEGSEIAVAMLIDKDPDQFEIFLQPWFATLWRSKDQKPPRFIIGRQLIVVFAVVVLTFLGGKISDIPNPWDLPTTHEHMIYRLDTWLSYDWVTLVYDLLFPTFLALWIAQLPSKFIADQDPLRTYSWSPTRWIIHASLMVGAYFQIEHVSTRLSAWLLNMVGEAPEPLPPGRRSYYETSARLRGGRAVSKAEINITIGSNGAVSVREVFEFHSFAHGLQKIPQRAFWEAPYAECRPVRFTKFPSGVGKMPKIPPNIHSHPELKHGKRMYEVAWDIEFQGPLPPGEFVGFELEYATAAGAVKSAHYSEDRYFYNVSQVPTKELIVNVVPAPDAPFVVIERDPIAEASEEKSVNDFEARRITIDPLNNGGLCFRVEYPLLNTQFVFNWAVGPG